MSLFEKATDAFEYAIAIDKTYVQAYLGLSDCYSHLGNTVLAIQALRDTLEYTPDRPFILYRIGRLYLRQGNFHTASTYLHDALKEDPSYSIAWNDLGRCCERLGYPDEAAGYYRRAIDLEPDADEHWICLADLYLSTQRYAEACALLESSRGDATDRFSFDSRLLYCYYKLGRRNRLFSLLMEDSASFGPMYHTLLVMYPEFAQDTEIVDVINSLSTI
jgi:Tfp pilus assembly protein PilF